MRNDDILNNNEFEVDNEKLENLKEDVILENSNLKENNTDVNSKDNLNSQNLNNENLDFDIRKISNNNKKKDINSKILKFFRDLSLVTVGAILIGSFGGASFRYIDRYLNKTLNTTNASYFIENSQVEKVNLGRNDISTIPQLYENLKKSIVAISSQSLSTNFFYGTVAVPTSGTGVVFNITPDSVLIVTNEHVVGIGDDDTLLVAFEDEKEVPASVVGKDVDTDLAVIKVKKSDISPEILKDIKAVVFSDSNNIKVGEFVMAIGNPLGYKKTATFGIVSGLDRHTELTGEKLSLIQTDASINSGNSGGALVNMNGEVIGINAQKISSASADGIAFSIPSNTVKEVITELLDKGYVSKPQLGIYGINVDTVISKKYKLPEGIYVSEVLKNSGADKAGLKAEDIIESVNGITVKTMEELSNIISKNKVGDKIQLGIIRENVGRQQLTVILGEKENMNSKQSLKEKLKTYSNSNSNEKLFRYFRD